MAKTLNTNMLLRMEACWPALNEFRNQFGFKASVADVVRELRKRDYSWEAWLLSRNLPLARAAVAAGVSRSGLDLAIEDVIQNDKSLQLVKFLVDSGANIKCGYWSPLRLAAMEGRLKVAKLLVRRGAKVFNENVTLDAEPYGKHKTAAYLRRALKRQERKMKLARRNRKAS